MIYGYQTKNFRDSQRIIDKLKVKGYQAYHYGGQVREAFRSDASPEIVREIASHLNTWVLRTGIPN